MKFLKKFVKSLGMTKEDENIPAADQSLEGMINEAFGTVAVTKLDDFKTGKKNAFSFANKRSLFFREMEYKYFMILKEVRKSDGKELEITGSCSAIGEWVFKGQV